MHVRSKTRKEVKISLSGIDLSPKLVGAMFPQAFPPLQQMEWVDWEPFIPQVDVGKKSTLPCI